MPRFHGRMGRRERLYATVVIGSQPMVLLFGALAAFGLAHGSDRGVLLGTGCALALGCFVVAGLLGRPYGVTLGWLVQLATFAWALVLPAMLVIAVVFLALWVTALHWGVKVDARDAAHAGADRVRA